jgi:hypothetical protein
LNLHCHENLKSYIRETGCEDMEQNELDPILVQWWGIVSAVFNHYVLLPELVTWKKKKLLGLHVKW